MNNINNNTNTNPKYVTHDFFKTPMNYDLANMYFNNFKNYQKTFSPQTLEVILSNYTLRSFTTFQYVPQNMWEHYEKKGYYELTKNPVSWTFKEYNGEWEKQVNKSAREFIIPDQYQSTYEKNFLKDCLLMDFPYLKDYTFDCYQFEREDSDIYVKTEEKGVSLYAPIKAFKEKNPQLIIDRMKSYWTERSSKQLDSLESKIAKSLFEDIVSSNKTNNDDYVRCNNCLRIFPEERLGLFADEGQEPEEAHKTWYEFGRKDPEIGKSYTFFKGCPFCKTDAFLTEIE